MSRNGNRPREGAAHSVGEFSNATEFTRQPIPTQVVIRFPPSRFAAVFVRQTADGWLVLAPHGHGWLHATLNAARADARQLARNLGLPIRDETVP